MIRYFYFAAFLLFVSCSEENKSEQINADKSKTPNRTNFNSQNKIDYGPSNVELGTCVWRKSSRKCDKTI